MNLLKRILLLALCCVTGSSFASAEQERVYLVQLMNQLDAMTPMILAAEREQPQNQRLQFHYTAWRDNKGQLHNGLLEDIKAMKNGIREKLNSTPIEPRAVSSIQGDYLDKNNSTLAKQ